VPAHAWQNYRKGHQRSSFTGKAEKSPYDLDSVSMASIQALKQSTNSVNQKLLRYKETNEHLFVIGNLLI
jgi:hypothetical protein